MTDEEKRATVKWIDFKPKGIFTTRIHVRQLGIPKLVIVRTKANGGIR